ncbi:MAG: M43 family zinc metalloprotease [Bacteroidota bacterium]
MNLRLWRLLGVVALVLSAGIVLLTKPDSQTTRVVEPHSHEGVLNCGTDELIRQASEELILKQEELELEYQAWMRSNSSPSSSPEGGGRSFFSPIGGARGGNPPPYTLPIVFHILHNNGPENISDARIQTSLDQLNASMANMGYYDQGTGVNTQIQFCMAERTPDNMPTNGITRQVTPLTELEATAEDLALKDLARWDTRAYVNVYVVREICGLGLGCGVAGYAYYPSAHGGPVDGIVVEARWLGDDEAGNAVLTHEIGHYLGLRHTFDGGCTNDDCLMDGDRVCDTPPDNSTAAVPCGGSANTCTTDTDSGFATDQPDMHINYMDYGFFSCYSALTAGQSDRMHFFIDGVRASLLDSYGCLPPCPSLVTASFTGLPGGVLTVGDAVNLTSTSTGSATDSWLVDNVFQSNGSNFNFTFTAPGTYTITLQSTSGNTALCAADERTVTVQVVCPYEADISSSDQFPIEFTNITYSTTDNATFYEWTVDGVVVSNTATLDYNFPGSGIYELCLRKGTGACEQTSCRTIFVSNVFQPCSGATFAQNLEFELGDEQPLIDPFFNAMEFDGADIAMAGGASNAIYLAKVTAVGQPIWSRRINFLPLPNGTVVDNVQAYSFYIDNDGNYLVWGSYGPLFNGKNMLIKYDPVNDQVLFARSYELESHLAFRVEERPGTDEYFLINQQVSGLSSEWGMEFFSVDRNTGDFIGSSVNRFWTVAADSVLSLRNALWHEDQLFTLTNIEDAVTIGDDSKSCVSAFNANGALNWSRVLVPGTAISTNAEPERLWADENGVLVVSRFNTGAAGTNQGHLLTKFDLNGQLEWQESYFIGAGDSEVLGVRSFQGGYILLLHSGLFVPFGDFRMGLAHFSEQGEFIWSRSYGDDYEFNELTAQNLLTTGNNIFIIGGRNINALSGGIELQTFLYRLDEFGVFQDECTPVAGYGVDPLQVIAPWQPRQLQESTSTITEIDDFYGLEEVSYLPNNSCNSPCFEICDNGIDDDFNGETDCEDAALAQTCCCLPGPVPPDLTDTILCSDQILTIRAPELEGGSFTWSTGTPDSILRINSPGDYALTLVDSCGRDTTVSFTVDFIPPSTPPDLGPDTIVCANGITELDAGPGWTSYLWFDLSNEQTASAWGPGDFWVQVTDSCGLFYSDTITVDVQPATEIDLGPPDDTIACGIDSLEFTVPPIYDRYEWFPVGIFNCNNCPSVRFAAPPPGDSLTIFALGYTEDGCAAGDSIRIWTPAGQGQTIDAVFCAGTEFVFGDTILTEGGQYFFNTGCDNADTLNLTELPPIPTLSENLELCRGDSVLVNGLWYVAPATAIDTFASVNGCDSVFVTNLDVFLTAETSEILSLCTEDSVLIGGQWYQAPNEVADTSADFRGCDSVHTFVLELIDASVTTQETLAICAGDSAFIGGTWRTESGIYTDSLVGILGCDSLHEIALAIDPLPELTWLVDPQCGSDLAIVTIVPTAGQAPFDIIWDLGPGTPPLSGAEQLVPAGTYRINITDGNGCASIQDIPVPLFPPVDYELESGFFGCPPDVVEDVGFILISDISQLLQVSINGEVQTPADSIGLPAGSRFEISITDIQGCVRDTLIEPEDSEILLSVTLPPVITIDLGDSTRLDPQVVGATGAVSYDWLPDDDLSCTNCENPFASPANSTDYLLIVSDESGCIAEASVRIVVVATTNIFMPTAFSPNEDGVNDRLFPGLPPAVVQIQSFQIFDRWGGRIHAVEEVRPEDARIWGWNGESRGRPATVGVYVWTLEVLLANGQTVSLAGDVTLVR